MMHREMISPTPEIPELYVQKGTGNFWHICSGKLTCVYSDMYREKASEFFAQHPKVLQIEDAPNVFVNVAFKETIDALASLALLGTDGYEYISPHIVKVHGLYHIDSKISYEDSKILGALLLSTDLPCIDIRTAFEYPVLLRPVLKDLLLELMLRPNQLVETRQKIAELLIELTTNTEKLNAFFKSYDTSRFIR